MLTPQNILIGMGIFAFIRSILNRSEGTKSTTPVPSKLVGEKLSNYALLRYTPATPRRVFVYLHGFYTTGEEELDARDFRAHVTPGDVLVIPYLHRSASTGGNNAAMLQDPDYLDWLTEPGGEPWDLARVPLTIFAHSAGYAATVSLLRTLQNAARRDARFYHLFPIDVYLLDATYGYIEDFRRFVDSGIARLHIYQSNRSQDTQRRGVALEPDAQTYRVLDETHQSIVNATLPTIFGGK